MISPDSRQRIAVRLFLVACAVILGCGAGIVTGPDTGAYRAWCRSDPIVSIDGVFVDIFVSAPLDAILKVTGPTEVVVTVPRGIDAWLVASDLGFGHGERVSFEESRSLRITERGIEVQVEVYVPSGDDDMPVRVEFAPRIVGLLSPTSAEGTANQWIDLEARA